MPLSLRSLLYYLSVFTIISLPNYKLVSLFPFVYFRLTWADELEGGSFFVMNLCDPLSSWVHNKHFRGCREEGIKKKQRLHPILHTYAISEYDKEKENEEVRYLISIGWVCMHVCNMLHWREKALRLHSLLYILTAWGKLMLL